MAEASQGSVLTGRRRFTFMDLPAELRNEIYAIAAADTPATTFPLRRRDKRVPETGSPGPDDEDPIPWSREHQCRPYFGLIQANRAIRAEFLPIHHVVVKPEIRLEDVISYLPTSVSGSNKPLQKLIAALESDPGRIDLLQLADVDWDTVPFKIVYPGDMEGHILAPIAAALRMGKSRANIMHFMFKYCCLTEAPVPTDKGKECSGLTYHMDLKPRAFYLGSVDLECTRLLSWRVVIFWRLYNLPTGTIVNGRIENWTFSWQVTKTSSRWELERDEIMIREVNKS